MTAVRAPRDLRAEIVDHATRLFAEQGYSATSVRELVEACNCTKPSLYYYFDGKETLFKEIVEMHMNACNTVVGALAESDGSARDSIHAVLDAFSEWAESHPYAMQLLQRIETQPEEGAPEFNVAASREMHLSLMSSLIARGIETGEIRADVDPLDCAITVAGALSFQFEMALGCQHWDRDRLHRTIDLIFDGIKK